MRKDLLIKRASRIEKSSYMLDTTELRDFQKEGVQFLRYSWACILAFPTGLGKTVTSLSAYAYLKDRIPNLKLIYVSEKSILPQTSNEDLPKFFKGLKTKMIFENTIPQRNKIYQSFIDEDADILFMNYHTLVNDKTLLTDIYRNYKVLTIYDEADNISGASNMSKVANYFAKLSYRVFALTATPSRSNLEHIHNIFTNINNKQITQTEFKTKHCIIEKGLFATLTVNGKKLSSLIGMTNALGVSFKGSFRKMLFESKFFNRVEIQQNLSKGKLTLFNNEKMTFKLTVSAGFVGRDYFIIVLYNDKKKTKKKIGISFSAFPNVNIVGYKNISKYVEKVKKDLFVKSKRDVAKEIPPFTINKLYFKEDKETMSAMREYYNSVEVASTAKIGIALSMPQLITIDDEPSAINPLFANNKIKEVNRIVVKAIFEEEKVIIFSPYRTVIESLINIMIDKKIIDANSYNTITGASKDKALNKTQFVEDVNRKVMFITEAGLKGLNLQVANNLIIVNQPKNAGDILQLCIAGDSLLEVRYKGREFTSKIKDLPIYNEAPLFVKNKENVYVQVINWFDKGVKETIKIELEDGRFIICTKDHLIETNRGFVQAQDLREDDDVITR